MPTKKSRGSKCCSTRTDATTWSCAVSDNGRGIPHSLRHLIFGRFVRLGSELEREKPGTGLGLYIVRTMVGRLGGKIRIRDRDRGGGTAFEVQLPGRVLNPPGNGEKLVNQTAAASARP